MVKVKSLLTVKIYIYINKNKNLGLKDSWREAEVWHYINRVRVPKESPRGSEGASQLQWRS